MPESLNSQREREWCSVGFLCAVYLANAVGAVWLVERMEQEIIQTATTPQTTTAAAARLSSLLWLWIWKYVKWVVYFSCHTVLQEQRNTPHTPGVLMQKCVCVSPPDVYSCQAGNSRLGFKNTTLLFNNKESHDLLCLQMFGCCCSTEWTTLYTLYKHSNTSVLL